MNKLKKVLAILAIASMLISAGLTLVFALMTNFGAGDFSAAWKASAWAMVVIPAILYAMLIIYKVIDNHSHPKNSNDADDNSHTNDN